MTPAQIAADAISAFLDYLDRADCDLMLSEREIDRAKAAAMREYKDAANADWDDLERLRTINAELLTACEAALNALKHARDETINYRGTLDIDKVEFYNSHIKQVNKAIQDTKEHQ